MDRALLQVEGLMASVLPMTSAVPACGYCSARAEKVTGKEIYPRTPALWSRKFWRCPGTCNAWVGCHGKTGLPLGSLARHDLRAKRSAVHLQLDPLWMGKKATRSEVYALLAERMDLPPERCHIGMFDMAQCYAALEALPFVRVAIDKGRL